MSVHKQPNGRFRAPLKSGRTNIASKTFDTKREAEQWLARERAALARGIDPEPDNSVSEHCSGRG